MSVKIWCDGCDGQGFNHYGAEFGLPERDEECCSCFGKGYLEKGCENCGRNNECYKIVLMEMNEKITFCTAWKAKQ